MKTFLTFISIFIFSVTVFSQDYDNNTIIPTDPTIIKGKLDNGLTYYVKENKMPENRVEMRLVVNVGSIVEDEDQLGLAHFFEHMCFNGTKHFEKQKLVDFLEETGVKFGPDLNAYTSFDETVFYFQITSERNSLLDTGLMVLYDWAQNVSLDSVEVDKERGVVIEEWRLGLGADDRMLKKYLPVALKDSRYEKRLPIGSKDILENFKYNTLKRYYSDWYRPDLMAIIVVGDIDKYEMEEKIKEQFSKMPVKENERDRVFYIIPNNKEPLISIVKDVEASNIEIQLFYKHDKMPEGTVGAYKEDIKNMLYNGIMSKRIHEIIQKPQAPFIYAATEYGGFLGRTKDAYTSYAVAKENEIIPSLETLLTENQRMKIHGVTQGELERMKKDILTFYESALKEKDKTDTKSYGREFTRNFLTNEPIPGIEKEFEYVKHFLPLISVDDINALAKNWIIDSNIVVIITGPDKESLKYPTDEEVSEIIKKANNIEVEGYVDNVDDSPLIEKLPKKKKIKSNKYNPDLNYTELILSNGAKVIVKHTDFKNDEVLFSAFSYGGESMYGNKDIFSVKYADYVTQISGVGKYDNITLEKKMAGSTASLNYSIGTYSEEISGNCSPDDVEDLFKLNYLYYTAARKDTLAFQAFISRLENQVKFLESDPRSVFSDTVTKIINSNDPRSIYILKPEHIAQIDNQRCFDIFKERYSNPADFLYIFIGNITIDQIKPYLEQYLASIPSNKTIEKWNDIEPKFPENKTDFYLYKGIDPQSMVYLFMEGEMEWNRKERLDFDFLSKALSIRLREKIREDEGGTYGVRVRLNMTDIPESKYSLTIGFGCDPNKSDTLYNIVLKELQSMINNGPTEEEMIKVKEIYIRERETAMKTNEFWSSAIKNYILKGDPVLNFEDFKKTIADIKPEDIIKVSGKYINMNNYVHAVLLPENMKP